MGDKQMKEEIKKSLLLSMLSFSKILKLSINEEEHYIAKGKDKIFNLENSDDIEEAFRYLFINEINSDVIPKTDEQYLDCYLRILNKNYDSINEANIQNSIIYDSLFNDDECITLASTLTLSVINEKPQDIQSLKKLLNI